ncbi:MAG: MlaE family ABC transporter permease [Bacteroidales bacterium]
MIKYLGEYVIFMHQCLRFPLKWKIFYNQFFKECRDLGFNSLGIISIISTFSGAIVAIQTASNIKSALIPKTMVGFATRQLMILEFCPTIISLIIAGKVGSRIASEIASMKVSEQLSAMKIMGINPVNHVLMPKVLALVVMSPIINIISIAEGIIGGWIACITTNVVSNHNYIRGLRHWYNPFSISYSMIKIIIFAFIITSVAGFQGYRTKGGAIEVGRSSTKAVVYTSILIIIFDLILTQMLLV